jgi:hypothetical protein
MAHQQGIKNAVAVLGTALGDRHLQLLRRYTDSITLVLDGDDAGRKRTNEILDALLALFEKNEVDFLLVRDNKPWVLIEVKNSQNHSISKNLYHFQEVTGAEHALQVVFDMEYRDINCFSYNRPVMVPLITFLSQLI